MSDLVSDDLLYMAVERYVDHLISKKQRSLVALYVTFLNRGRRIAKYAQLLLTVRTSTPTALLPHQLHLPSGQSMEAAEVLEQASNFFPLDMMQIIQKVVDVMAETKQQQDEEVLEAVTEEAQTTMQTTVGLSTPGWGSRVSDGTGTPRETDTYTSLRGRVATPRMRRPNFRRVGTPGAAAGVLLLLLLCVCMCMCMCVCVYVYVCVCVCSSIPSLYL